MKFFHCKSDKNTLINLLETHGLFTKSIELIFVTKVNVNNNNDFIFLRKKGSSPNEFNAGIVSVLEGDYKVKEIDAIENIEFTDLNDIFNTLTLFNEFRESIRSLKGSYSLIYNKRNDSNEIVQINTVDNKTFYFYNECINRFHLIANINSLSSIQGLIDISSKVFVRLM